MNVPSKKQKTIGVIRVLRPQFLVAYVIVGFGGIIIGIVQGHELTNRTLGLDSFMPVLIAAMGVHLRDEAGDWIAGYDKEHGGMGVIRDGFFNVETIRTWGIVLSAIAIILGILQAIGNPILFVVGIPMCIVIIFSNYLTEEVPSGHETVTASSYWGSFLWVYLAQKWPLTLSILLFSLFIYILVLALIPYQDIGDFEADTSSGKKTLTVKLGLDGVGHLGIAFGLIGLILLYFALLVS